MDSTITTNTKDDYHPIQLQGRGASRSLFSPAIPHITPQYGSFGDRGEVTVLEKSSTDKLRKLSADCAGHQGISNNGGCGIMGCVGSDCEDELRLCTSTIKRIKFPKKLFDGRSTVGHVSVPRKLRSSAMKKRSSDSFLSPLQVSNKLNRVADGDQLLDNDGLMKSKLKMKQGESEGRPTNCIPEAVTKDEEEVVEALYALSGVFPNNARTDTTKSTGGLEAKSSTLTRAESLVPSLDAVGRWADEIVNNRDGSMPNLSSSAAGTAGESPRHHCLNDTAESDSSIGKQPPLQSDSDTPEVNLHLTAFISENQQAICDSVSGAWTQLRKARSKLPTLAISPAKYKFQENPLPPIADARDKAEVQNTNMKTRNNGLPSRPDPSLTVSCDSQRLGISFQSCVGRLPTWIESSSCSAQSPTLGTNTIVKKNAQYSTLSKNSWKRCTAHVYVCHFIKASQDRDVNKRSTMQSSTMNEAPKQRAHISDNDQTGGRNCLIGVVSSDTFGVSSPAKDTTEVKNAILLHKRLVKDQQQASSDTFGPYDVFTAQNQSLDFLSMPAGGLVENSSGINRAGNGLEALTSVHFPCLQSQNQAYIAYPGAQNLYLSTSSSGHRPVTSGLQVQFPPYFGSRSYAPPHTDANVLSVQHQEHQLCNRPPLLMANFESGVVLPIIPNKQIGGPEIPPFSQRAQTSFPHSLSSLVLGSRYAPILQQPQQQQQQEQLISATSPLPSTVKGPYHHLPSVYEANVGRVRPDNASLQIICNHYI